MASAFVLEIIMSSRNCLIALLLCFLPAASSVSALVYTYENTTAGAFDDTTAPCASPLLRTFTVNDSFTVSSIALGLNITHTYRGDIRATLVAPGGSSLVVVASANDSDDNYDILVSTNTEGARDDNDIDPVGEPYYNRLVRNNAMNFYTGNSAGTWTLQICDTAALDSGTFNRAQLMLESSASTTTSCASGMTYDWGANGNNAAFSNTTVGNTTLTQTAAIDYGGAGTQNLGLPRYNFRTGTGTYSSHTGYYGFYMDACNQIGTGADSETIMERVTFTFSPTSRDLNFSLADNDFASNDFEDYMRVTGLDANGDPVPYTITPGSVHQRAGYWIEGDSASNEGAGSTTGTASYQFDGAVSTLHIDYGQGDEPQAGACDQWLFLNDFSFCTFDYGDAPSSYGSARHVLGSRGLYLGSSPPDGETVDQPGSGANGDDSTSSPAVDDENAVSTFPNYASPSSTYTVSVNAVNTSTTTAASLVGYIDFDRDGDFGDAGERSATVTVPANTGTPTAFNVTWSSLPVNAGGTEETYARFRIAYVQAEAESPTGLANSGEVEDFVVPINTLPVTVAYFSSSAQGAEWITASETASAGFRLLGSSPVGRQVELGLLPAHAADSQTPQEYRLDVAIPPGIAELWLEEIDLQGKTRRHGPYLVGTSAGTVPESSAIDWQALRDQLSRSESPRVATKKGAEGFAGARIEVSQAGIQRVTHQSLLAAGIDLSGTPIPQIALLDQGLPIARAIPGGPIWNAASAIEFYFEPKLTLASPYDVVELRLDPAKARAPRVLELPSSGVSGTISSRYAAFPDRAYSNGSPTGDPFFDERILAFGAPSRLERSFDLPDLASGKAELDLKLWGVTNWDGFEPDHHLVVRLNGREIVDARFDGLAEWRAQVDVSGLLLENGNHLEIELPLDTGYLFDMVHFDGFSVDYRRDPVAQGGLLEGATTSRWPIAATGFAGDASLWSGGGRALLRPSSGQVYLPALGAPFTLAEEAAQPQPVVRAGLPAKAGPPAGNFLILTSPAFAGSLDGLVALEKARGYAPVVVETDAIYAAFSDYAPDPQALQRFVAAYGRGLEYVLLVGAESYDPYDHLGLGSISFVPTFYRRVNEFVAFGPTDEPIVDRDGDGLPDLPIGRLPVRTPVELQVMIDKMWAWQNSLPPRRALISAGQSSTAENRELTTINTSFGAALGKQWTAFNSVVDEQGSAAVRSAVLDAFAQGMPLISYVGHSSFGQWDVTPILRWQDVSGLGYGGRPSVVLQWGCWNGYYASPEYETLSSHLLLEPLVGAVATVGSSTLTSTAAHQGLGSRFMARVAAGDRTLGRALLNAKRELYTSDPNTFDAVWGQVLLGDPATPLP